VKYVAGIDPGLSGALALFNGEALHVFDVPTVESKGKRKINEPEFARFVDSWAPQIAHCFIEQVGAMPKQGIVSAFNFGVTYGQMRMAVMANFIPLTPVVPRVWKKALGVPADKDGARARASELLPQWADHWPLKKHDGRAEAALLALYGLRVLNPQPQTVEDLL
jgi:hypothetical protein